MSPRALAAADELDSPYALKQAAFEQLAGITRALASPSRLLLLELIAQGTASVEHMAQATGLSVANASQHLRTLRAAGLVRRERDRQFVRYRLAGDSVVRLMADLHTLAVQLSPALARALAAWRTQLGALEPVSAQQLLARMAGGDVTVVDTRPSDEFRLAHLPGAINIPLADLDQRLGELAGARQVVAYCRGTLCLLASTAVARMRAAGLDARRLEYGLPEWRAAGHPVEPGNP